MTTWISQTELMKTGVKRQFLYNARVGYDYLSQQGKRYTYPAWLIEGGDWIKIEDGTIHYSPSAVTKILNRLEKE